MLRHPLDHRFPLMVCSLAEEGILVYQVVLPSMPQRKSAIRWIITQTSLPIARATWATPVSTQMTRSRSEIRAAVSKNP